MPVPKTGTRSGSFYGGVISQTNPDRPTGTLTERRCPACRTWYLKRLGDCPECQAEAPKFNARLRTAILDNHLHSQAAHAARE